MLSLDDLQVVVRDQPHPAPVWTAACAAMAVGNLRDREPKLEKPASKPFKTCEPGYFHINIEYLPQMPDESLRRYLFVAIDRAARWVFVQIKLNKTAAAAKAFLQAVDNASPCKICTVLTDNGAEFTHRLFNRERHASEEHQFDTLCETLGIRTPAEPTRTPANQWKD